MDAVVLRPAAAPSIRLMDDKKDLTFICPSLPAMGIRLTWSGEKRVLELLFSFSCMALDLEEDVDTKS